jgi:hypothetical protein
MGDARYLEASLRSVAGLDSKQRVDCSCFRGLPRRSVGRAAPGAIVYSTPIPNSRCELSTPESLSLWIALTTTAGSVSGSALATSCLEQPRPLRAAMTSYTAAAIVDMDGRQYARQTRMPEKRLQGAYICSHNEKWLRRIARNYLILVAGTRILHKRRVRLR